MVKILFEIEVFTWDRLFEINHVVSKRFVKFSNVNKYKNTVIFCWKNVRIFCSAKDSHIFPTKNNSAFDSLVGIYLTS